MESQKKLIKNKNWDMLIILDACRYDYFEKNYQEYLSGELEKVKSAGTDTPKWLKNTFGDGKYDMVYISGNIRIGKDITIRGFCGSKHFKKVVEVWDYGWDEEYNTVPPREVRKMGELAVKMYPDERKIVHFMQPHFPFLGMNSGDIEQRGLFKRFRRWVGKKMISFFGRKDTFNLLKGPIVNNIHSFLRDPKDGKMEVLGKKRGKEFVREMYEDNLRRTLKEVKQLVKNSPGEIIITADHGDFLGEDGKYSHKDDNPFLKKVPWLKVINNNNKYNVY